MYIHVGLKSGSGIFGDNKKAMGVLFFAGLISASFLTRSWFDM